ncbi:MAG: VCBS repeat-containing protein [Planctomycetes bacterium]|nr:VCBS repeat-containing protein [Planctomycetota bacterium]
MYRPCFRGGLLLCFASTLCGGEPNFPRFEERVIDPHAGDVVYAVTLADVDGDQRDDIVAVTENRVLWYQAPDWQRRVILEDQTERDNVGIAPLDIDGDGKVDFALGAGWTKIGTIQWLSRGDSLDEKWRVHEIGREPWLHRMRFADVLGSGKPQLVISPLNATQGEGVRLTAFAIPADPASSRWPPTMLDDTLNRMHNHWHVDLDADGSVDTLTASQEGVHLIRRTPDGFSKTKLGTGAVSEKPEESGAGEIKTARLKDGRLVIATIEPMHGNQVAIYTRPAGGANGLWERHVVETELVRGHALWAADLDGDGSDELVVGHSNTKAGEDLPRGVYVYDATNADGTRWQKHVLDEGGVAVEDAVVGELTGDDRPDIVAGGRYTHNVKLYINRGTNGE